MYGIVGFIRLIRYTFCWVPNSNVHMSTVNNIIIEDGDWFVAHVRPGSLDQLCSTTRAYTPKT